MSAPSADLNGHEVGDAAVRAARELAGTRSRCLELGLEPEALAKLFAQEALLAWMMAGLSEHQIHERLTDLMRRDLREWFYLARMATGQCDCVREVHIAGLEELKALPHGVLERIRE
jgi:hypothetical protein